MRSSKSLGKFLTVTRAAYSGTALAAFLFVGSSVAQAIDAPVVSAKAQLNGTIKVQISVRDPDGRATGSVLDLQRAAEGGKFGVIAQFQKPKKKFSFVDKSAGFGTFRYRARISKKPKKSAWSKLAKLTFAGGSATPTPTPGGSGTNPTPVPTRTPTPTTGNFDGSGNVTAAGKALFGIPSNLSANVSAGRSAWQFGCQGCHGSEKLNKTFSSYRALLKASPMFIFENDVPDSELANLTAYLNRFRP